jgi:iron complex transport system ATP-binding protein
VPLTITARGLRAGYGDATALRGVDLRLTAGNLVAIVGPNGCGKSTLLRCLARLHQPSEGQVAVNGQDVRTLSPRATARTIALLPQSPLSPEGLTVAGLVAYGRHPHQGLFRRWSVEDERVAEEAMRATAVLDLAHRAVDTLSGGQRQRAWVAMVLAQQSPVLLLDEPTSALDLGHQVEVLRLLREVAGGGRLVVVVMHDLAAAVRYADHLVALKDGLVVAQGPPAEVVDASLVRELFGVEAEILRSSDGGAPVVVPRL